MGVVWTFLLSSILSPSLWETAVVLNADEAPDADVMMLMSCGCHDADVI